MDLYNLGDLITVVGEVMVGWTALAVHHRVRNEHRIDDKVFKLMRKEDFLGKIGLSLIVAGLLVRFISGE